MLRLKKTSSKKTTTYIIVLIILFVGTGVVIYNNFFTSISAPISPVEQDIETEADKIIQSLDNYNESELSFINSRKFKELRDNFEQIKIDETGNRDLFVVPKD